MLRIVGSRNGLGGKEQTGLRLLPAYVEVEKPVLSKEERKAERLEASIREAAELQDSIPAPVDPSKPMSKGERRARRRQAANRARQRGAQ